MTTISTLGQALNQIENIQNQQATFADLSTQLTTGRRAQTFSGLGTDTLTSIRSRTDLTSIDVFINNITRADTTINLTLASVEEFQAQTNNLADTLIGLVQEGSHQTGQDVLFDDPSTQEIEQIVVGNTSSQLDVSLQSVISQAESLFPIVEDLLNAQEGETFLLAGADGTVQPFEDNGLLDSSISTLLERWREGLITTDDLIADLFDGTALEGNPDAITDTTIGFSASISNDNAGRVFVRADENREFEYTTLANESSLRDVIVSLAVLSNENLPPVVDVFEDGNFSATPDAQGAPGETAAEQQDSFYELYNAITQRVVSSIDEIDNVRFRLETVRVQANETLERQEEQRNLLLNTVSAIEDVDTNLVALQLTTLQTQIEASFRVTALTQNLTLSNFL